MRFIHKIFFAAAFLHIIFADRQETLDVVEKLRDAQIEFDTFRDYVNKEVTAAKQNSTQILVQFHQELVQVKELYLQQSFWAEEEILYQLNSQSLYPPIYVDNACLGYARVLVDDNMKVAGVEFTKLHLQQDATVADLNVLLAMDRINILKHPDDLIPKIADKLSVLEQLIPKIAQELNVAVDQFEARLGAIAKVYRVCLVENDNILKAALDNIRSQLLQICKGRII
ncbi:hypothetical protein pipiens_003265 [Culex pipiens pipiens]|uniref:Uncharacterized protein n=1 Tax=Culex pipiens pipiens TaxID=38569 RepID=A0ABD1D0V1_CULPP